MLEQLPIVVFSHQRWDSVGQRLQQLVTRLAKTRQVIFIEEPVPAEDGVPDSWDLQFPLPRLVVCRAVLEAAGHGFDGAPVARLRTMTERLLRWQDVGEHVAWLYTPLAYPVARALEPALIVYDRVEELPELVGSPVSSCSRLRVGGP